MQVINKKFYSKYYNDTDFATGPTDFNNNLAGSVMEEKKVVTTVNINVETSYASSSGNSLSLDNSVNTITLLFGNFINDGFRAGDIVSISGSNSGGGYSLALFQARILSLTATSIVWVYDSGTAPTSTGSVNNFAIQLKSDLTSFLLDYGVIENNDATSFLSSLDGVTNQGFYGSGINHATSAWLNLTPLGQSTNKSWINGSSRVKFVARLGVNFEVQQFEIEHTFLIPYYLDGELTNLQTGVAPADLLSSNSYKYIADYKFRIGLSDASSERVVTEDLTPGSVGYFNESYNGFNNNFSVSGLSYTDAALNPVSKIVEGAVTKVNFNVDSSISSFSLSSNIGCYVSFLPSVSQYTNPSADLGSNFMYENVHVSDGVQASNTIIQAISTNYVNATKMGVSMDVIFTDARLTDTDHYLIAVEVATDGGNNASSDRVMLVAALDTFDKSADVPNLFDVDRLEFEMYDKAVGTKGYTDVKGWVEDTINVDFDCYLDLNLNAYLNDINLKIVAFNPVTLQEFNLENIQIANSGFLVGGTQQYNVNTARGFNAPVGDFNNIKFNNGSLVGTKQYYNGNVSIKLNWQDWSSLPGADSIFYDASKLHNGLNNNSSNYSLKNGYEIRVFVDANVKETVLGLDTNYIVSSPTVKVYDYDLDDNLTPEYSGSIATFDILGNNLSGAVLNTGNTDVIATYNSTVTLRPLTDYYAIISLEPVNSTSKNTIKINNATLSLVGSTILAKYTVPSTFVTPGVDYKISSRLFCEPLPPSPFARLLTQSFTGGTGGAFAFNCELKEIDDSTALPSGSAVTFTLKDGATVLESIEGVVGNNINTFTAVLGSPSPASSITLYASGIVTDGGSISFNKRFWADANNLNYNNGSMVGSNWVSSAVDLKIEVKATDPVTGFVSYNSDNSMIFEQVVDLIEGSVFAQTNSTQDLAYSMCDNDGFSINYLNQTVYQKKKDSVLVYSTLPSFTPTNFSWGTRDFSTYNASEINCRIDQELSFNNGMIAKNTYRIGSTHDKFAAIGYNRTIINNDQAETFVPKLKSAMTAADTEVQRAAFVTDNITPGVSLTDIVVYLNGTANQVLVLGGVSANSSEGDWIDIDLSLVGQRNTIKYVTTITSSSYEAINEFQLELNYAY